MTSNDQQTNNRPHLYDNPAITPKNFLLAVMRDPSVPLSLRIDAATFALPLTAPPLGPQPRVHPDLVIKVPPLPEPGLLQ
jgi:hypothetical protein